MEKKTIIILTIIILAILVGGFWYVWDNQNNQKDQTSSQGEEQIATTSEENEGDVIIVDNKDDINTSKKEIDTSDWKEYRNEEYGYEIKYPQSWIVDDDNEFVPNKSIVQLNYNVGKDESAYFRISIPNYGHGSVYEIYDKKKIKIDNIDVDLKRRKLIESYQGDANLFSDLIIFRDKKNGYESSIEFNYSEKNKNNFKKIFFNMIDSFKFF